MAEKAKKFRSNWFRVAVEGATTDKRKIERSWLEQAAKNFNQATYGARIWLEHFRSVMPDSAFKAYGDVTAVKTEEVEIAGQKKLALFAQIEPTSDLVAMNKAKQKIYTSIEIDPEFADTGEAYLVGLAVTDSPASLGTDVLAFSAQKPEASPFKDRHYSDTAMFTESIEADLDFEEVDDKSGPSLFAFVMEKLKGKQASDDTAFADVSKAIEAITEHVKDLPDKFSRTDRRVTELSSKVGDLDTKLADLMKTLGETEDHSQQQRPPATGGDGQALTQF